MFLLKWKYPDYFIMYKEVTGLAGKIIALVIGISLVFFKMAFGDTVLPINWMPALNSGYVPGAEVGSVGSWGWFMSTLCPSASLYWATQQQFHLTAAHYSRPRWSVPQFCPVPQIFLWRSWQGTEMALSSSALEHQCPGEWSFTRSGRKNRTIGKGS